MPAAPALINEDLIARQGQTLTGEFCLSMREFAIAGVFPSDHDNGDLASVQTNGAHCVSAGERVVIEAAQCGPCDDVSGCYTVAEVKSSTIFTLVESVRDGSASAHCAACASGRGKVPVDLSGTEFVGQIRPGWSSEAYAPSKRGRIKAGENLLYVADCDGCPGIALCDYVSIPSAGIDMAIVQRVGKRVGAGCSPYEMGCVVELDRVATTTVKDADVYRCVATLAELSFTVDAPCGVVRWRAETADLPVPFCCPVSRGCGAQRVTYYGPHRYDIMWRTPDGDFFVRAGEILMLPSVTVAG